MATTGRQPPVKRADRGKDKIMATSRTETKADAKNTKALKKQELVLGSRGSPLARAQSGMVKEWLEKAHPGLAVRLEIIKTSGDTDQGTALDAFPALGVFVKEIQNALLDGRIDAAVHSLKDVPEEQPEGLLLAAYPPREDARDVFVSKGAKNGVKFADLP